MVGSARAVVLTIAFALTSGSVRSSAHAQEEVAAEATAAPIAEAPPTESVSVPTPAASPSPASEAVSREARDEQRIRLAVLDLQDKGIGPDLASTLTDILTAALAKLGVFQVVSRADLQKMLELQASRQMLGCDDVQCLAEIGGALGVGLLITGSVGRVGSSWVINLTLADINTAAVKSREQRQVQSEEELAPSLEGAARQLVRELVQGQQGTLILTASEPGADVEIDGRIVGVTPLARQTLPGGPHTVRVVKTSFVSWARDVEIEKDETLVVDATLAPSAEFIAEYDASAFTWRMLAYAAGGVGLGLTAFGVGGLIWNDGRAQRYENDLVRANCAPGSTGQRTTDCTEFEGRRSSIEGFHPFALSGLIGGAVLLGVSAYLFIQGPEVGAYDRYKAAAPALAVVPLADGVAAVLDARF